MVKEKKAQVGRIQALIVSIIMLVVLLSVAETIIPTGAEAYHNLTDTLKGDGDVLGTDAASFVGDTDDYVGWFWVIGPFVLVLTLVGGLFFARRRRR